MMLFYFRLSSESDKCSSSACCPSQRVTFNDKNEVASQDLDGSFTVTYRQLGEKITARKTGGLRVQFGERSNLERTNLPGRSNQSLYRDVYSGHGHPPK